MSDPMATLVSLNVALPTEVMYQQKSVQTGIFKQPVEGVRFLRKVQLEGDGQGDLKNHGGPDKALCAYAQDHFPYWERTLGIEIKAGAFGENVTLVGMTEQEVCIGDRYKLGGAVVEVSQPRQPCFKLAMKHGVSDLVAQVQRTGYTGYYFRVIEEGPIEEGSPILLLHRGKEGRTISWANEIMYSKDTGPEQVAKVRDLLAVEALAESWRRMLTKRLPRE